MNKNDESLLMQARKMLEDTCNDLKAVKPGFVHSQGAESKQLLLTLSQVICNLEKVIGQISLVLSTKEESPCTTCVQCQDLSKKIDGLEAFYEGYLCDLREDFGNAMDRQDARIRELIRKLNPNTGPDDLTDEEAACVKANEKIKAIKLVRERTGMGLKDAREHVQNNWKRYGGT